MVSGNFLHNNPNLKQFEKFNNYLYLFIMMEYYISLFGNQWALIAESLKNNPATSGFL